MTEPLAPATPATPALEGNCEAIAPPSSLDCGCWTNVDGLDWCPQCRLLFAPMSRLLHDGLVPAVTV